MDTMKRLEDILDARNLSLRSVSQMSDVSYSTLKTAHQKRTQLSVDTIEAICNSLNIPLWLFFIPDGPTDDDISMLSENPRATTDYSYWSDRFGKT